MNILSDRRHINIQTFHIQERMKIVRVKFCSSLLQISVKRELEASLYLYPICSLREWYCEAFTRFFWLLEWTVFREAEGGGGLGWCRPEPSPLWPFSPARLRYSPRKGQVTPGSLGGVVAFEVAQCRSSLAGHAKSYLPRYYATLKTLRNQWRNV